MTMKLALVFALGIASTAAIFTAHAQTYQWKDSNGRTVISDTPPPGVVKAQRTVGGLPATAEESAKPAEKLADAPKSTAEKDLEFKKRQQESKEKAEKLAKEQATATEKRENCDRARRNLATLESSQPMVTVDESGERKIMDTSLRDQEMERARRFMAESCN